MAYCPECGAEFRGGIRRCPECRVDLLEELEDPSLEENQEENLVLIRAVNSSDEAKKIKDLLLRHGILSVVELPKSEKSPIPSGLKVLVNEKDEPRAQEVMRTQLG
jgi:hypothetical protein